MTKKIIAFFFVISLVCSNLNAKTTNLKNCGEISENFNPKIELIDIKIKNYKRWTENGIRVLIGNFRWVPERFKKRFDAKIVVNFENKLECEFTARVRHNGNQKDHIKLINNSNYIIQSLDVRLKNGKIYGISNFKLLLENTRGVLEDEIILTNLLRKFGYIAPRTLLINAKLNDTKLKMIFQENATNEMLKFNKRLIGPIFRGDERFMFRLAEKLPDNNLSNVSLGMIPLLEKGVNSMLVKQHNSEIILEDKKKLDNSISSFSNLSLIYLNYTNSYKSKNNNFEYFNYTLNNELLGFYQKDKILKLNVYNLLLNATNSLHGLSVNNRKFYWNAKDNYFEPINYDNNANFDTEPKILMFPLSSNFKDAFSILKELLKNTNVTVLNKEVNDAGINQKVDSTKMKIEKILRNMNIIYELYENYEKEEITENFILKTPKEKIWDNYYNSLKKIDTNIGIIRKIDQHFEICDINLNCERKSFTKPEIIKFLNGNYFKDKREYQFIGQEIGKSYLIRHEL